MKEKIISYLLARMSEASTWRGIVMLLTALGVTVTPEQSNAVIEGGLAATGLIGIFFADNHGNDK